MSDHDRPLNLENHLNDLYREIYSADHIRLKCLQQELTSALSTIKTQLNQKQTMNLNNYSAIDLTHTTHWTSKDDLQKALCDDLLASDQTIDSLWLALTNANKGLQQFYPDQLSAIIEYKKKHK